MDIFIKLSMKESERYEIVQKLIAGEFSEKDASKLMNLGIRQVRRLKKRVKKFGLHGIVHKNRGQPSNRKLDANLTAKALVLIKTKYFDFKPTFASEKLEENDGIKINRETLRKLMIGANIWKEKPRKTSKKHHSWRPRKDNYGEMQQFDGSYHKWFEDRAKECCLLLSVDDATGEITHAKFDHNEGVVAVYNFWMEYIAKNGIPLSIYLDKFSTYKINHPSAVDNKELMTQFQRASQQVGIKLITAHSPEAKGRVERMNGTLQDRLVKELRLANISTIKEGNEFLKTFIPKFNKQFAVMPNNPANLHKNVSQELKKSLPQIFSIQHKRKVNNDYTIMFENKFYQLEEKQPTTVFKKDTVIIEKHLNGTIKINLKNFYLKYTELQERPKKQKEIPLMALTNRKPDWTPPKDHIWRKMKINPTKQIALNQNKEKNELVCV